MVKKVFSFDIGTASIGWSVINENNNIDMEVPYNFDEETGELLNQEDPFNQNYGITIEDAGVRMFNEPLVDKTKELLNVGRRNARLLRRRLKRKKQRLQDISSLLLSTNLYQKNDFNHFLDSTTINSQSVFQRVILENTKNPSMANPFYLRVKALDEKLSPDELGCVLYHIAKYRGFKSSKKNSSPSTKKDSPKEDTKQSEQQKEDGKVLKAIEQSKKHMEDLKSQGIHIRTQVEYLHYQNSTNKLSSYHNKFGDYNNCIERDNVSQCELPLIFAKQREFYPQLTTDFEEKFAEKAFFQRPIPSIANMVGNCSLEKKEKRASKNSPTAEKFIALGKLINLRIYKEGVETTLTKNEIDSILMDAQSREKTQYTHIRKILKLNATDTFHNLKYLQKENQDDKKPSDPEKKDFLIFTGTKKLKNLLENMNITDIKILDEIAQILSLYQNSDEIKSNLEKINLNKDTIDLLIQESQELNFTKFISFSHKALYNILPIMEEVEKNEDGKKIRLESKRAIDIAYPNKQSEYKKGDFLPPICKIEDLNDFYIPRNHSVIRVLTQFIKTFNALVKKHGKPNKINIELLREFKYPSKKKKDTAFRDENEAQRQKAKDHCIEYNLSPNEDNILKLRLWDSQRHECPYCQTKLTTDDLGNNKTQIDHIIPYSISLDDSQNNKVLVCASCNQNKGNKTPYMYFNGSPKWNHFLSWVNSSKLNNKKTNNLLNKQSISELTQGFIHRQKNDTAYATTLIVDYINNYFQFEADGAKRHVYATKGGLTSLLRDIFAFKKYRKIEDVNNHKSNIIFNKIYTYTKETPQNILKEVNDLKKNNKKEYDSFKTAVAPYLFKYFMDSNNSNHDEENDDDEDELKNKPQKKSSTKNIPPKKYEHLIPNDYIHKLKIDNYFKNKFNKIDENFIGDKHHALDAILIGLCSSKLIQNIGTMANKLDSQIQQQINNIQNERDKEYLKKLLHSNNMVKKLSEAINYKYLTSEIIGIKNMNALKNNINDVIKKIFVSRQPSRKLIGSIHKDTIYSAKTISSIKKNEPIEYLKQKKLVTNLQEKDIPNIIGSQALKDTLKNYLKGDKTQLPTMPTKNGSKGAKITSITIQTTNNSAGLFPIRQGLVEADKKIRVDIFEHTMETKKGKIEKKYIFRPISLADILINKKIPLQARIARDKYIYLKNEDGDENNKFLFSLYPGDLFLLQEKEQDEPQYVYYVGFMGAELEYKDHDKTQKKKKDDRLTFSIQKTFKLAKAQVGILGEQYLVKNNAYQSINFKNKG